VADVGQALLGVGFGLALITVLRPTRTLLALGTGAIAAATAVLAWALLTSDFSLAYVAETSRRGANGWYRFAALWGGSAGSLLVLALVVGAVAVAAAGRWTTRGERRVLAVPVAALAGTVLIGADPFAAAGLTPVDGVGMTPILEHPAMAIHPPLLYIGLAATLPPYAAAVGGRLDDAARARARRWLLLVGGALTVAMALGGLWSYVEAGWGGYWAWDPVENASLAVWLAALVALHRGIAGRDAPATLPAVLAAAGTALTRSGAISSVHSFAEDDTLGWILGGLALAALAGAFVAWNRTGGARRTTDRAHGHPLAAVAAALLGAALIVVAIGTATPAVRRLTGDPGTAVGGWFYARLVGAVAVVALCALLLAAPVRATTRAVAIGTGTAVGVASLAGGWGVAGAALAACAVAVVVTSGAAVARRRGPMWLAHLGIGVLVVGVAGTTAAHVETVALTTAASEQVGPVRVTNAGVSVAGDTAVIADVVLHDGGVSRATRAALVAYPAWDGVLAETAVWSRPWRDVQVTLVRADDAGRAVLEVRVRPLAQLLWWGAILTAAGVALCAWRVSDRRVSSGAASRASSVPAALMRRLENRRPGLREAHLPQTREAPAEAAGAAEASAGQSRRASDPGPAATAATPAPGGPGGRARSTSPPGAARG
jgi:cytochrome c-type biogenesis protein CcmF